MMITLMPISGSGFFGLGVSPAISVATLILHLIFGVVLGVSYRELNLRAIEVSK
jgi:hypothetical protein